MTKTSFSLTGNENHYDQSCGSGCVSARNDLLSGIGRCSYTTSSMALRTKDGLSDMFLQGLEGVVKNGETN